MSAIQKINMVEATEARRIRKVKVEAARREKMTGEINKMKALLLEARPSGYNRQMEQLDVLQQFNRMFEEQDRELKALLERNVYLKAELKVRRFTETASRKRKISEEDSGRFSGSPTLDVTSSSGPPRKKTNFSIDFLLQ